MAGLQVFSRDLCPKKGRHISRADLFLPLFNFHEILISVSLPLLIPASVLPDKPAVRCHAVREHDSLCSIGNLIERTRRRRTSGGRSPTTTAAERRYSNRSSPAGLEHRKKSHPMDGSFFYVRALPGSNGSNVCVPLRSSQQFQMLVKRRIAWYDKICSEMLAECISRNCRQHTIEFMHEGHTLKKV